MKSIKPNLVNALILDRNEHALVVHNCKQYNRFKNNRWEFPGGKVKKSDRNLEETAIREVEEELGIKIKIVKKDGKKILGDYETQTLEGLFICRTYFAKIINGTPRVIESCLKNCGYSNYSGLWHLNEQGILAPNLSLGLTKLKEYMR